MERAEYFAGIDIGAVTAKAVLVAADGRLLASAVQAAGYDRRAVAWAVYRAAIEKAGCGEGDIAAVVSTGYGRAQVSFADKTFTEITCHARGAAALCRTARTVIDLGGQDSKVIALDGAGRVLDFAMNEKCAAGTGRFLELMALALEADLADFGELSAGSREPVSISSTCTVFAESEVISQLSRGSRKEDIIAGIHAAVASRVRALAGTMPLSDDLVLTGGVARNSGLVRALQSALGRPIVAPQGAQTAGALGAALSALRLARGGS